MERHPLFCETFKQDGHPLFSRKAGYRANEIKFALVGGFEKVSGDGFPVGTAGRDLWGWCRIAGRLCSSRSGAAPFIRLSSDTSGFGSKGSAGRLATGNDVGEARDLWDGSTGRTCCMYGGVVTLQLGIGVGGGARSMGPSSIHCRISATDEWNSSPVAM